MPRKVNVLCRPVGHTQSIAEILLLNGTLLENPVLWHDKTDIVVFFFHYAKYTGNDLFEEYAANLITVIQSELHAGMLSDYELGIAGTGAGMEYLIRQNFLSPGNNNVFADFDSRIYRLVMHETSVDLTLADGLSGCGRYLVYRLQGNVRTGVGHLNRALVHILREMERNMKKGTLNDAEQTDITVF